MAHILPSLDYCEFIEIGKHFIIFEQDTATRLSKFLMDN